MILNSLGRLITRLIRSLWGSNLLSCRPYSVLDETYFSFIGEELIAFVFSFSAVVVFIVFVWLFSCNYNTK